MRLPILAALTFGLALPTWPQASTATVRGTVKDQTGAVIPNAGVDLVNAGTNVRWQTRSNEVGFYIFPGIVPGEYRLAAESAGMQRRELTLTVQVQQSAVVDVMLVPGQTATAVEVRDATPVIVVDNPTLGHVLERGRIEHLPINGRSLTSLLVTVPGMEGNRAFGLREGSQEYVLDGAPQTDKLWGGVMTRQPGLDTIQEFNVEVNSSSAKFTRPTSIIMSTKSGSNQLHGAAFETHRNNAIGKARTRTDVYSKPPQLIRNEFGASLGGPVYIPKVYNGRDRTFFFFAYEGYRNINPTIGGGNVFTEAMRNGDFSGLVDSVGRRTTLYDPWTTDAAWSRQPFNYNGKINNINPSRLSPLAKHLYGVTPLPTLPDVNPLLDYNWWGVYDNTGRNWTTTARIDHRFSDKDSFYGRFTQSEYLLQQAFTGEYVPTLDKVANYDRTDAPNKGLALSWVHSFSPTLFNEVLLSGQRELWRVATGEPNGFYSDKLGLPNPFGSDGWPGIYSVGLGGQFYYESENTMSSRFNYFILDDNATKVLGKHELMFGFHLRYDQLTALPDQQNVAGNDNFSTGATSLYDPTTPRGYPQSTAFTGQNLGNMYIGVADYTNQFAPRQLLHARPGVRPLFPGQLQGLAAPHPEPGAALGTPVSLLGKAPPVDRVRSGHALHRARQFTGRNVCPWHHFPGSGQPHQVPRCQIRRLHGRGIAARADDHPLARFRTAPGIRLPGPHRRPAAGVARRIPHLLFPHPHAHLRGAYAHERPAHGLVHQ